MNRWLSLLVIAAAPIYLVASDRWENAQKKTLGHQSTIPGWCSAEKAIKMMDLIHDLHPKICVEIGVFGGSSIYPTASALKFQKSGIVYAVDPWDKEASIAGYALDDPNYLWWAAIDYEKMYRDFLQMLHDFFLTHYCKTLRMDSVAAVQLFDDESIDILHIDGNHSEDSSFRDAVMFFPKIKTGGYIWFDDVNWVSTRKASMFLSDRCELILDRSIGKECFLFQKL